MDILDLSLYIFSGVRINGDISIFFHLGKGIRQGDPILPYLFLLVSDALSRILDHAVNGNVISRFKINRRCLTLTHLLFADDTILFGCAFRSEAQHLKRSLDDYIQFSRQCINLQKSDITFSGNMPDSVKQGVEYVLHIPNSGMLSKYLGSPFSSGRSKSQALNFLKDSIRAKLFSWKAKFLTMAGLEILIKVVIQAIPSYIISVFNLPNAKQAHKMLKNPDALWVKVIKGIYYPFTDFMSANQRSHPLWGWSSLIQGREVIRDSLRWNVSSPSFLNVWEEPWIPSLLGFKIASPRPRDSPIVYIADLIATRNQWDINILRAFFSIIECREIIKIPLRGCHKDPAMIWHHSHMGIPSVKAVYNRLKSKQQDHISTAQPSSS
ncbi:uncharacterized protein LOC131179406 [Hevea brasiliensis]|uniref:uncharacterized protein LOC131179406 n=1 Tax=Hevea brasiliensis TaxID=3981 RepID=UPI0025E40D16|nr:uncharacterized protein LOC131179406 [Hevea brasiliensis]